MAITLTKSTILASVKAEVAQVADLAYDEGGNSLYDAVIVTTKDEDLVEALIDDAVMLITAGNTDIVVMSISAATDTITVNNSDAAFNETSIGEAVRRYVMMYVCSALFQQRRPLVAPEYTRRAQEALDDFNKMIRQRTAPTRS